MTEDTLRLTGERTAPGIPSENYWFRRHVAAYRWARRNIGRGPVLDAGAGEGYGAALLARRGPVIALELDASAAEHLGRRSPDVPVVRADCCRLPVADGSLDAVVALQVIEHLHCAEGFVEGCARSLRPGGRLILSTPNRATFPGGLNPFHTHEYVAAELEGLLRTAFREVRVLGLAHRAPMRMLDRALGRSVQHRLVRDGYEGVPAWARAMLRSVTSNDFGLTRRADSSLDLLAVAGPAIA